MKTLGAAKTETLPDKASDDGTTVEREDSTGFKDGNEVVLFILSLFFFSISSRSPAAGTPHLVATMTSARCSSAR